ncbi:ArsR family transcriptional regulator [Kribbella italica]|uniref:DNA-binding transcriptional ArsR family regulator n=1 Tax=Kribbella italica TaxID=1540520 RepID=A0A7W9MSU0_9ACTN|nr:ArsR family transcriptional regulator [Kribbella italica]MBB5834512.1 DNA-binding transcriptional ArsR family regulator [Kribbella italica]
MSLRNPYGDFEVTDPQAMRALAHPVRLAALSYLQKNGPATATQLSEHVGASPSVTSWHLRHLAGFGLVTDGPPPDGVGDRRQRWWQAAARGFRYEMPDTPEGTEAGRLLRAEMMNQALEAAQHWLAETEPRLDPEWNRAGGGSNTLLHVTQDELETLENAIEDLLAPYVQRGPHGAPAEARPVRHLRMLLPEATDS